jgi:hypothetical protein
MDIFKMSKNENLKDFLKKTHFPTPSDHNALNYEKYGENIATIYFFAKI